MLARSAALDWSVGDWVLAAAAEHGRRLADALGGLQIRRRPAIEDAAFTALYVTPDEREELDEIAVACGLNRSAFVTAVSRLAMGDDLDDVLVALQSASGGASSDDDGPTTASADPAGR